MMIYATVVFGFYVIAALSRQTFNSTQEGRALNCFMIIPIIGRIFGWW